MSWFINLSSATSFHKTFGNNYHLSALLPFAKFSWNWPTSADDFAGSQRDMHKKITVASFPEEIRLKFNLAVYSDSVLLHLQPVLHSETALVANGSCQWPCIDKLPPKCSWCDLFLPSLTSQPTSWKKVMTSQTDRKRQAEIAAAGADSVMMGGNRWQPALSLQDRYSTTGDLKGSSCKLERGDYREIHSVWSGFCFSGCLLLLVYSHFFSSQPEYFRASFRSLTFF